ncbi:MAG: HEAT repeat domain-containing protein [Planctomycetes bacterium]|nr:HEAT repeat domain-containing protein [Planctomycetota bacterium]
MRGFPILLLLAACSSGPEPDVKSPYPYGRYLGALKLAEHPNASNVRTLVAMLEDPDHLARSGAVVALAQIGRPEFAQHLIPRLDPKTETSAMVRGDVCLALARLKNPAAIDPLLAALQSDPESVVRREAGKTLPAFGKKPAILRGLSAAVADPDVGVAWRAHVSLQELTGAKAVAMTREAWDAWIKDHP